MSIGKQVMGNSCRLSALTKPAAAPALGSSITLPDCRVISVPACFRSGGSLLLVCRPCSW